ncbi:MAG: HIT family protein [Hyphomonadaceae bacterium]
MTGLDGAYDPANIFAKMLRSEMACVKAFEDEVALAIMDIFPQTPGHTLVLPKAPARNFLDFPNEALGPYMQRVQKVALAVRKALEPDGVTIMQFNGAAAGQTVFHLHFHILPRWEGVPLKSHAHDKVTDMNVLEAQARRIAAAL